MNWFAKKISKFPVFYHVPDFKWTFLQAQEELEKVLGIYIDRKKAALSIGEVYSAIGAPEVFQRDSAPFLL